ncbi:polynucleotide adenylyltransferase domain protein [Leptospira interrogans str. 2002000626]|uniref:Polynucleotide adenylyltransferase domain protein n=1 Tax=Leptospira interrogans str. 2002000626 TaxID=996803 RepID=A0A829CZI8_LEPIR|nr:polynucleotide adenylyltransferase domain protein [Leptospira interrogans str. 2002000626]
MKFLSNLFKKKIGSVEDILSHPDGKRYYRDAHLIRKNMIDEDAVKIIHRLNKFGFKAYIVGGGFEIFFSEENRRISMLSLTRPRIRSKRSSIIVESSEEDSKLCIYFSVGK